ncbi:hypothetical protein M758_4G223800 [Ceratodon purpureus]|nr:hypothetical protein M758_4G223800 [Ceratodon purpureus]
MEPYRAQDTDVSNIVHFLQHDFLEFQILDHAFLHYRSFPGVLKDHLVTVTILKCPRSDMISAMPKIVFQTEQDLQQLVDNLGDYIKFNPTARLLSLPILSTLEIPSSPTSASTGSGTSKVVPSWGALQQHASHSAINQRWLKPHLSLCGTA